MMKKGLRNCNTLQARGTSAKSPPHADEESNRLAAKRETWVIFLLITLAALGLGTLSINLFAYADFDAARGKRRNTRHRLADPIFLAEWIATLRALVHALVPARAVAGPAAAQRRGTVALLSPRWLPRGTMRVLRRRLHAAGWGTVAIRARNDTSTATTIIARCPGDEPLAIVAFGGAGLTARLYALRSAGERPLRVVTLATPHQGTRARFAPPALRPDSSRLRDLALLDQPPRRFDPIAIYSDADAWVFPIDDAYYPGAFNIEARGIGHLSMLFSRRVATLVLENLAAPGPTP